MATEIHSIRHQPLSYCIKPYSALLIVMNLCLFFIIILSLLYVHTVCKTIMPVKYVEIKKY